MRKIIVFTAFLCVALALPLIVFADADLDRPVDEEVVEEYSYASTASAGLTVSNTGTAKPKAVITGLPGTTTKLSATMYLQKYSNGTWQTVQSWSDSTTLNSLSISKSKSVSRGRYRTHVVFKAYHNSNSEQIVKNSGTVTY